MMIAHTPYLPLKSSPEDLKLESYDYPLPSESIAQRPLSVRHQARLLVYHQAEDRVEHDHFFHLQKYLPAHSLLVANKTKVFPCRLPVKKPTGGRGEIFLLQTQPDPLTRGYPALIRAKGVKKRGDQFFLETCGRQGKLKATIEEVCEGGIFSVSFERGLSSILDTVGMMPIPPYIRRGWGDERDRQDYQTLFARRVGSVAAPTAGLHFTPQVFQSLNEKGIERALLTLHVGAGTFSPVRAKSLDGHKMHSELFCLEKTEWEKIKAASFKTLVGTTSLRALESFIQLEKQETGKFHCTHLFLHPGKAVQCCQALITNFHLPRSTLLMLVSSLIGRSKALALYGEALREGYRFLSYGDAMLILRRSPP